MRLRLLDRYVLSELLYPFIFGIASFSSIFIASSMLFKLTQYMTKYGASGETIARLFMYSLPEVVNYTFPMSMLLASLMAFGKLSGSSEIVAMKSGGISYYRIVAPVLIVAFFVSMFSVVWAEKVVPAAKVQYGRILEYEIKKNTKPRTQDHVIIKTLSGSTQRITYARRFDEEKGLMENITIEEFEKSHLARIQTAKQAYWENGSWRLEDGTVYTMNEAEGIKSTAKFKEQIIPLDVTPREISWEQKEPEEMTIRELREYISVLEKLFKVRDIVLKVNLEYIYSAGQADEYRSEPAFKLQGSYRNMNKIAEKILPIMNDEELFQRIIASYENDSQTLTNGAEANMLKWKEIVGCITEEEKARYEEIKSIYNQNKLVKGDDMLGQAVMALGGIAEKLNSIKEIFNKW